MADADRLTLSLSTGGDVVITAGVQKLLPGQKVSLIAASAAR